MIQGIGTDICENYRIEKLCNKYGKKFLEKIFLTEEIQYCYSRYNPIPHLAARFALKESFVKSLSIERNLKISYKEVGIIGEHGKKQIKIIGKLKKILQEKKIQNVFFSISHGKKYSTALIILEEMVQFNEK